jgi:hypothetical protein
MDISEREGTIFGTGNPGSRPRLAPPLYISSLTVKTHMGYRDPQNPDALGWLAERLSPAAAAEVARHQLGQAGLQSPRHDLLCLKAYLMLSGPSRLETVRAR